MTPVDPSLLASLPQLICDRINTHLPDLRECEPHPGRFDLKELKAFMAKAPAVRVALLGIDRPREAGGPTWAHPVRFAAFIITKGTGALEGDAAAIAIAQAVVTLINGQRWGSNCLGQPESLRAQNLYSAGIRKQGVFLWAVDWTHMCQLHNGSVPTEPPVSALYAAGLEAGSDPIEVTS